MPIAYEQDFLLWTEEQAAYLRSRNFNQLDIEHLVDEIISMGKAVVIDYHLETPEAARESPGFIVCFLEGFLENWNAPLPKQQKKRQDREKTSK